MREDMFKVIVERPRGASRWAPKSKLRLDKCPDRANATGHRMALEQRGWTKCLNENLAPLKRYLHAQVGRKWDDVFSDICAHLDTGSTVKMHVRTHIDDFVMRHVRRDKDGHLTGHPRWGRRSGPVGWHQGLYVDPDDGRLKKTDALCRKMGIKTPRERWRRKPPPARDDLRRLSETECLVRLRGVWYEVTFDRPPRGKRRVPCTDHEIVESLMTNAWRETDRWQVTHKRQLNKKELKALRVQNDPPSEH